MYIYAYTRLRIPVSYRGGMLLRLFAEFPLIFLRLGQKVFDL